MESNQVEFRIQMIFWRLWRIRTLFLKLQSLLNFQIFRFFKGFWKTVKFWCFSALKSHQDSDELLETLKNQNFFSEASVDSEVSGISRFPDFWKFWKIVKFWCFPVSEVRFSEISGFWIFKGFWSRFWSSGRFWISREIWWAKKIQIPANSKSQGQHRFFENQEILKVIQVFSEHSKTKCESKQSWKI